MDRLELTEELLGHLKDYMLAKQYPYNTCRTYGYNLGKLFRNYTYLSRENLPKILKDLKHSNQRAILVLINRYCFDNNVDFQLIIPRTRKAKEKRTILTLSVEEIDIMIKAAPKPYDLMIKCIFRIGGGLRISEAIKLEWKDFRWPQWIKEKQEGAVEIKASKSGDRLVSVPRKLMLELYDYARQLNKLNEFGLPMGGIIFPFNSHYGKAGYKPKLKEYDLELWRNKYIEHAYHQFLNNVIKKHCEPALGKKLRIHSLRHTRATQLYDEENVGIEIIQDLLGHKEIQTTMIYTKVNKKKVFDAMKGVD